MEYEQKTLLLNSTYEPLAIVSWRRAVIMNFLHKVEIIETYDAKIHSISQVWHLPAVIRLLTYVSRKFQPIKFSRANIYLRDRYTCQYCGKHFPPSQLTCDHVIPKSLGGKTEWTNIVTSCLKCNNRKGDNTPERASMKLLARPKKPSLPHSLKLVLGMKNTPESWKKYLYHN
ncbi:MAG: HNH endonuclease [Myxococcota bacterium]